MDCKKLVTGMGEMRNAYKIFVGESKWKKLLERRKLS
jgi:hypothetical protein